MNDIRAEIRLRNNNLYKRRKDLGLNQKEIAELIGIKQSLYSSYELMNANPIYLGKQKKPLIKDTAKKIINFFNVEFEDIWTEGILGVVQTKKVIEFDSTIYLPEMTRGCLPTPQETLEKKELKENIDNVLSTLKPREAEILVMRFGLAGGEEENHESIGQKFHITKERVRQIEAKALRMMRCPIRSKKLEPFCE